MRWPYSRDTTDRPKSWTQTSACHLAGNCFAARAAAYEAGRQVSGKATQCRHQPVQVEGQREADALLDKGCVTYFWCMEVIVSDIQIVTESGMDPELDWTL